LNALRIEKGFVHWGHDMSYTEAPHQIGLGFTCKQDKAIPFIGRDAMLERKTTGEGPFLCSIKLNDETPLLHHNEPVLRDGEIVGYVASGAFAQSQGASIGLCFVSAPDRRASLLKGEYSVMVEGQQIPATLSIKPILS
jgi:4-methylaminobutanoate oxidase (formaldehyde-forming)